MRCLPDCREELNLNPENCPIETIIEEAKLLNIYMCLDAGIFGQKQFSTVVVTTKNIMIFDKEYNLERILNNCRLKQVLFIDGAYMYCLSNTIFKPITCRYTSSGHEEDIFDYAEVSGLFVYDIS